MPISRAPLTTSSSAVSPAAWPSVRGSPRALAQRPLPSMTQATWTGTRERSSSGGTGSGVSGSVPFPGSGPWSCAWAPPWSRTVEVTR